MSELGSDLANELLHAVGKALEGHELAEVLAVMTGVLVVVAEELVKDNGGDPKNEIRLEAGSMRSVTISEAKQ